MTWEIKAIFRKKVLLRTDKFRTWFKVAYLQKIQSRYFSFTFFDYLQQKKAPMSLFCMRYFLFLYRLGRSGPRKELGRRKDWTVLYFCLWRIEVVDWNLPQPSIFSVCRSMFHSEFLSLGWILSNISAESFLVLNILTLPLAPTPKYFPCTAKWVRFYSGGIFQG